MSNVLSVVAEIKIRINGIAPGMIKTNLNKETWSDPERAKEVLKLVPYGRLGEPEDVAKTVVWLASDESDYITGATLFVDGEMALYPDFREGG